MNLTTVRALFALSGMKVSAERGIENNYWPNHPNYDKVREENPWWEVHTDEGVVVVGWRKRVMLIDWSRTNRRGTVTEDNVTKEDTYVHAWSIEKAVEYLRGIRNLPIVDQPDRHMKNYRYTGRNNTMEMFHFLDRPESPECAAAMAFLEALPEDAVVMGTYSVPAKPGGLSGSIATIRCGRVTLTIHPDSNNEQNN